MQLLEHQIELLEVVVPFERLTVFACTCSQMRAHIDRCYTPETLFLARALPNMVAEASAWTEHRVEVGVMRRLFAGIKVLHVATSIEERHRKGEYTDAPAKFELQDFTAERLDIRFLVRAQKVKKGSLEPALPNAVNLLCHWVDFPKDGISPQPTTRNPEPRTPNPESPEP